MAGDSPARRIIKHGPAYCLAAELLAFRRRRAWMGSAASGYIAAAAHRPSSPYRREGLGSCDDSVGMPASQLVLRRHTFGVQHYGGIRPFGPLAEA